MIKKTGLWRGSAMLFTFILALSIIIGSAAEGYKATTDTILGTQSERLVFEDTPDDPLHDKSSPPADVLNADGTDNSKALIQKAIDLNYQQAVEDAVLLKNNDENGQGLPLKGNKKVTLLGIRSHASIMGSSFGVKAQGPYISLEQALSQNRTDFRNTITHSMNTNRQTGEATRDSTVGSWSGDEFNFEDTGYETNPVMTEVCSKLNETYLHAESEGSADAYDPGEPFIAEVSNTNPAYKDSLKEYSDAAVVVIGRPSVESIDYLSGGIAEGLGADEPLQPAANERDIISLAKESSNNVIALINMATPVEIDDLKNDSEVDFILWIGFPGCYGMLGVSDTLCGRISSSDGLPDTYAISNLSAPAIQNMGYFQFTNADDVITHGFGQFGGDARTYLTEAGGIYVGCRYYETRYYNVVLRQGNTASKAGTYVSRGAWNHDEEVAYGFGYGLSYTDSTQEPDGEPVFDISINPEIGVYDAKAMFNVEVTNTGNMAGEFIVQVYGQAPYIKGGLEKSVVQLLNFDKMKELQPGESQVVSMEVDLQYIASYNNSSDSGDDTFGTYAPDPREYYFVVGSGAHDALNNITAKQSIDASKLTGGNNSAMAYERETDEDFIARTALAVSRTGEKISSQPDYADWNYFQPGEVTYLSHSDWEATYPKKYDAMALTSQDMIDCTNGNYYTIQTDDDTSAIKRGVDNNLMFYEMFDKDFDDESWQTPPDKMILEEAQYVATFGGPSIPGVSSAGTVETYMTENAGNDIAVNLNASKDTEAPWTISANDPNGNRHPEIFGNAPLATASFDPDLYKAVDEFVGEESLLTGIPTLWGPGPNTHRYVYNGRNGEHYPEDLVLIGNTAMESAIGALDYSLIAAPKHFAFNDQEANRSGVTPYMLEQRARKVELRAYQIAFEVDKYDTEEEDCGICGLMVSFSKIGPVECTASYGLMTNILKNEWGSRGYAVTDTYDDADPYGAVLASGTICFDTRGVAGFYGSTTPDNCSLFAAQADGNKVSAELFPGDARLQNAVKESAHSVLYVLSQSNLMNRYNSTIRIVQIMTWWRGIYMGAIGVSGLLTLVCAVLYVVSRKRREREGK